MGKARIVSGGTEGLYTVELLHNRDRINAEIETLNARITALEEELAPLETEREELVAERNAIASEIDQAVAEYQAAEDPEPLDVDALLVELSQVSAQIQQIDVRIAMLQGRILQAKQRRTMLQSIPANPQQSAWCADFTEDLAGEVGTVDLPGEGTVGEFLTWRRVIVRPGYGGAASYAAGRDGQMHFREGQSPEQAFFNAAILPGWQKWKPLHRIGTITALDKAADTCSLNLQSEDSSAQSLLIDPPSGSLTLTGVPIEYMDCNADAFETGDRVLVELQGQNWDQPKVIGFESNPKECSHLIRRWIVYATLVETVWATEVPDPGGPARGCGSFSDGAGSARYWLSAFKLVARTTAPLSEFNTQFMEDMKTIDGFVFADQLIHSFPGTTNNWQRLTAATSGTQDGSFEEDPIFTELEVVFESPSVTDHVRVSDQAPFTGAWCTQAGMFKEQWRGPLVIQDHPIVYIDDIAYDVIGWTDVENDAPDGLTASVRHFYARAVLEPREA